VCTRNASSLVKFITTITKEARIRSSDTGTSVVGSGTMDVAGTSNTQTSVVGITTVTSVTVVKVVSYTSGGGIGLAGSAGGLGNAVVGNTKSIRENVVGVTLVARIKSI
jgi:hypothetical protein